MAESDRVTEFARRQVEDQVAEKFGDVLRAFDR